MVKTTMTFTVDKRVAELFSEFFRGNKSEFVTKAMVGWLKDNNQVIAETLVESTVFVCVGCQARYWKPPEKGNCVACKKNVFTMEIEKQTVAELKSATQKEGVF